MEFEPITFKLKNGKEAILRSPKISDAPALLSFYKQVCKETSYLANDPSEVESITIEYETKFVESIIKQKNMYYIICEVDGELVGNCQLVLHTSIKTRHRAEVAIALKEKFHSLGIGSKMFIFMEEIAKSNHISRLELMMIEGNEKAFKLYSKMGFKIQTLYEDYYRFSNGEKHGCYFMYKNIGE